MNAIINKNEGLGEETSTHGANEIKVEVLEELTQKYIGRERIGKENN